MAFGIRFGDGIWREIAVAALAIVYFGGFLLAVEYALGRLHFMSSF